MAAVLWDRGFMQEGAIVMSSVLRNTEELCRAVQNKRRGTHTSCLVLQHDNRHLHTAVCTRALLEHFSWELFDHAPYSPDLSLIDCHLFAYLKNLRNHSASSVIMSC
jgi:hypothetical protein